MTKMTEGYIERLIELVNELRQYVDTTDCKDYTLISKLNFLIDYIDVLLLPLKKGETK